MPLRYGCSCAAITGEGSHDDGLAGARAPLRIWQDVGRYEWLLEANRQMHARLLACGYPVAYREFPAGHNYTAWSDSVWRGLEHVFPSLAQETTGGAVV
jgi:enterochelin esterase-like enzyme